MSVRWAVANGNYSATATWNDPGGGATVPAITDDVYANNYTVTLDQNVIANSLRTTSGTGITAGGTFTHTAASNRTIKCNAGGFYTASSLGTLSIVSTAGYTVTIQGTGYGGGGRLFVFSGDGTINYIGSIPDFTSGYNGGAISSTSTGTVNITGNLGAGSYHSATTPYNGWAYYHNGVGTVNITGNVTANTSGYSVVNVSTGPINITGNVTSSTGSVSYGVYSVSAGYITVIGTIDTAAPPATVIPAISLTTGTLYVSGTIKNRSNIMAVSVQKLVLLSAASTTWEMLNESATQKNIYTADIPASGNPAKIAVRNGTTYGPIGELTGTLKIPGPSNVLKDNPTDDTVGTLLMTPDDFWGIDKTTLTTAGSIGEYLADAATIDSTGDQIASLT